MPPRRPPVHRPSNLSAKIHRDLGLGIDDYIIVPMSRLREMPQHAADLIGPYLWVIGVTGNTNVLVVHRCVYLVFSRYTRNGGDDTCLNEVECAQLMKYVSRAGSELQDAFLATFDVDMAAGLDFLRDCLTTHPIPKEESSCD